MPIRLKNAIDLGQLEQSISTTAKALYYHCLTYYLRKSANLSLYVYFFSSFLSYHIANSRQKPQAINGNSMTTSTPLALLWIEKSKRSG